MKTCVRCATPLSGKQQRFCSDPCRYRHRDEQRLFGQLTCADCQQPMWRGPTSAPQGQARCRPCRRASPPPKGTYNYRTPCLDCGADSLGARCWPCYVVDVKSSADPKAALKRKQERNAYARRDRNAPGLPITQRRKVLAKWKAQGKRCTYCPALVEQVDHVIPLALGGTNHEGNLAPSCADCNARKNDMLVIEWKHRKMRKRQLTPLPPPTKRKPRAPRTKTWAPPEPAFNVCPGCGELTPSARATWCSALCNTRTTYRRRVGIPDLAPKYTRAA